MNQEHANVHLLKQLDITDLAECADLFSEQCVWHYFNPKLPELQGDYAGLAGFQEFFRKLGGITKGSFKSEPQSTATYGEELVVTHAHNTLTFDGQTRTIDVIVVWRIVGGRIVEAWDIPSAYTESIQQCR